MKLVSNLRYIAENKMNKFFSQIYAFLTEFFHLWTVEYNQTNHTSDFFVNTICSCIS